MYGFVRHFFVPPSLREGASLSAALSCSLNPLWALRLAVGGEWAFEKQKMNIGPTELTFDLNSMNIEAAAVRSFDSRLFFCTGLRRMGRCVSGFVFFVA